MARPLYVTTRGAADALCVTRETIWQWVRSGTLRATQLQVRPHYTDTKPRRTTRGTWLIEVDSIEELLAKGYVGKEVPRSILKRLRKMAESPNGRYGV